MIECRHKMELGAINLGLVITTCRKHGNKVVSDSVCKVCPDLDSKFTKTTIIERDFIKRSDQQIAELTHICSSCPLLRDNKTCQKMRGQPLPTDTVAQNPANHCPENKW